MYVLCVCIFLFLLWLLCRNLYKKKLTPFSTDTNTHIAPTWLPGTHQVVQLYNNEYIKTLNNNFLYF